MPERLHLLSGVVAIPGSLSAASAVRIKHNLLGGFGCRLLSHCSPIHSLALSLYLSIVEMTRTRFMLLFFERCDVVQSALLFLASILVSFCCRSLVLLDWGLLCQYLPELVLVRFFLLRMSPVSAELYQSKIRHK